jgi:hypothetical protein
LRLRIILNNRESMAMVGGGGITDHVHVDHISSNMDVHSRAAKLEREFQRKIR